jgi:hypothetical protein
MSAFSLVSTRESGEFLGELNFIPQRIKSVGVIVVEIRQQFVPAVCVGIPAEMTGTRAGTS